MPPFRPSTNSGTRKGRAAGMSKILVGTSLCNGLDQSPHPLIVIRSNCNQNRVMFQTKMVRTCTGTAGQLGKDSFLTFPACFLIPIIFSNWNSNCSNLLDMRNLKEQVKKAFCYPKLF